MRHQANPWITSNLWLLSAAMLPAIVLVGALLYFTGWAFTFSFTDLGLTGRKAVEWSWVDISEPDFGGALLNDCKYGYDACEQLVRLTLVRGSTQPYPASDIGQHRIRYALLVHAGTSDLAAVPVAAERFNNPIAVAGTPAITAPAEAGTFSFASVDAANVTLETVKKAEKSDALVLRLHEHANARANATITFGVPVKSARLVNLMEEGGEPLEVRNNSVTLHLRPFEIATLMLDV